MTPSKLTALTVVTATVLTTLLAAGAAHAQFGMYTLPKSDFVWNWGFTKEGAHRSHEDFSLSGFEAGFNCDLTGAFRVGNQMSQTDILEMQNQLRASAAFIYDTSQLMNQLDQQFNLDWAQLACKKYVAAEPTAEQKAERETKAREKMQREVDRRRARAQKQAD